MACRTSSKPSLVHRFAHSLLNSSDFTPLPDTGFPQNHRFLPSTSRRLKLESDIERLTLRLQREIDLHFALETAIAHAAGSLPVFPRHLPLDAQELLADIAVLEVAVSNLEEQMIGLKMQIRQERGERLRNATHLRMHAVPDVSLSESRMDRGSLALRSKEYLEQVDGSDCGAFEETLACRFSPSSQELSSVGIPQPINEFDEGASVSENGCARNESIADGPAPVAACEAQAEAAAGPTSPTKSEAGEGGWFLPPTKDGQPESKSLWKQPNKLSEEMVNCMIGIYCHLADPVEAPCSKHAFPDNVSSPRSPFAHVTSSSSSSISELSLFAKNSPFDNGAKEEVEAENVFDPYATRDKLPWADIGGYKSAVEVSWMSVGKEQLEYAADALKVFRSLVEQLSRVDVASMVHDEKLAFWINVYNALMMHAYLAYGVPKNDVKFFALIQKAAYTVGGQIFNAMSIEHVLLRVKAPSYRPQIRIGMPKILFIFIGMNAQHYSILFLRALLLALHKVKVPEGVSEFAISRPEPLVTFALSCGAYSSPAVRIYRADTVQTQLQEALRDYVRASVGVSKQGRLMVPKLLHCYARDVVMKQQQQMQQDTMAATSNLDESEFIHWLCTFLPDTQAAVLRDFLRQQQHSHRLRRASSTSSAKLSVIPFDLRLRYLFLLKDRQQQQADAFVASDIPVCSVKP